MAQGQTQPPAETRSDGPDEIVILSPFIVDASQDRGYQATSTLAGSRIKTELKNLSAPITVVTSEFLEDISATGINDILAFTVNTEGSRDFTATDGGFADSIAGNPQGATRIRGLSAADITRDYFRTISGAVGFDTYNLDQVTISRGPNSVLAGLGSPSGIINYSPQLATLGKNQTAFSYRFGSYGDNRATFNSNIVAKKDVLAVRLAGVWSDLGYKQEPAFRRDKRGYAAVTFQPVKKTAIRVSYEKVDIEANNPNSLTPTDDVTPWLQQGQPTFNHNTTLLSDKNPALVSAGNQYLVFYNKDASVDRAFDGRMLTMFDNKKPAAVDLWFAPRMSDNRYGNWSSYNTNAGVTNQKFDALLASIDQEILPNLYGNISYTKEHFESAGLNNLTVGAQNYRIDTDETRPTPTGPMANPHFGETFFISRGLDEFQRAKSSNESIRATLNYNLDLTKTNKWLGSYRFTGYYEDRETRHDSRGYSGWRIDRPATAQFSNTIETGIRSYLGGTAANGYQFTTARVASGPVRAIPETNATYDADGNIATVFTDTLSYDYALVSSSRTVEKLASSAFVVQGSFWEDRIIPTIGIRRDRQKQGSLSNNQNQADPSTGLIDPISTDPTLNIVSKTTKSTGVVVRPLPWLSLFYNRSENFVPNAAAIDLLGNSTASPTGVGRDWGVAVSLLENRLNVKLNRYELDSANATNRDASDLASFAVAWAEQSIAPNLAAQLGIPYNRAMEASLTAGDSRLANSYTSDQAAKGIELELTYNVTTNWRVMANVSKQEVIETNIAPGLTAFVEERKAYWQSVPGLWTGLKTIQGGAPDGNPWGLEQTGEEFYNQFIVPLYLRYQSAEGKPSTQLAKWHASALTNYSFADGTFKGFGIGGGARYIDKANIGSPVIKNAAGQVIALDLDNSFYNKAFVSFDAWISYETRLKFFGNRKLTFQLNGRDLQEDGGYRPIAANSDGAHSVFRIVQPRTFYFTTTLEF